MKGGRVTRTSACGLRFSRAVRCTISPEPPSTYSTLMPVSFSKSAKTRSYQPSPFSPLRPSALYTVTTFSSEAAEVPEQAVRGTETTVRAARAASGLRGVLGMAG